MFFVGRLDEGSTTDYETDVHDGVRDGNGKFNWRMKYAVQVPCKHPRLRMQVYDHDMFSLDGFACEMIINLRLFRML